MFEMKARETKGSAKSSEHAQDSLLASTDLLAKLLRSVKTRHNYPKCLEEQVCSERDKHIPASFSFCIQEHSEKKQPFTQCSAQRTCPEIESTLFCVLVTVTKLQT